MTIRELAKSVEWKDVKKAIKYFYPTDKNDYESLFTWILKQNEAKHKDKKEFIELVLIHDEIDKLSYYSIHTNKYSLSLRDWNELINIPINEETFRHYKVEEIIAHFIWEITFYGNQKQSKKLLREMQAISRKIKANPEKHTRPFHSTSIKTWYK